MWSYDSARSSHEARQSGLSTVTSKELVSLDPSLPNTSHHHHHQEHPSQEPYRRDHHHHHRHQLKHKQPGKVRFANHHANRDVDGIARLIHIFNSSIVIDETDDDSDNGRVPVTRESSATPDDSVDASKTCSRCKGERTVRRSGPVHRRILCKSCAVKHGRRSGRKNNSKDEK